MNKTLLVAVLFTFAAILAAILTTAFLVSRQTGDKHEERVLSPKAEAVFLACREQFSDPLTRNDPLMRDFCYKEAALGAKDTSACGLIEDDIERNTCYLRMAFETKDSRACGFAEDKQNRDDCYLMVANALSSLEMCGKIQNPEMRRDCRLWLKQRGK